jgi:hypothetical protein
MEVNTTKVGQNDEEFDYETLLRLTLRKQVSKEVP